MTQPFKTVLLGGAGTGTSFALATAVRRSWGDDVRLIGIDINPPEQVTAALLCDQFAQVPPTDSPEFGAALAEVVRTREVTDVLPILNGEFALCRTRDWLGPSDDGQVAIWADPAQARLATDKAHAAEVMAAHDLPIPTALTLQEAARTAHVFVKPISGTGSIGARRVAGARAAEAQAASPVPLLIQEVCDGPEITVDSLHDSASGRTLIACRERLETKAGVCTKARVFHDDAFQKIAHRLALAIGQVGAICFQVMRVQDRWVITDLNLRSGAGTAISCAVGFDILSAGFACRWGLEFDAMVPPFALENEHVVTRQYSEFVMT